MRYLLDTDWVIHYLNGHPEIVPRVQELSAEGIGLSLISLAELYEGVLYSRNPQRSEEGLQAFLRGVELVGIDDAITKVFGRERGRLRAQGKTVGDFDLLIGGHRIASWRRRLDQQSAAFRADRNSSNHFAVTPNISVRAA